MFGQRNRRWILRSAITALLVGVFATLVVWKPWQPSAWYDELDLVGSVAPLAQPSAMESRITSFCGNCHAMPAPESFPRDAWHDEVLSGYEFYARSGLTHLDPPPIHATVDYFRSRAPEQLTFPVAEEATTPLRAKFTVEKRKFN